MSALVAIWRIKDMNKEITDIENMVCSLVNTLWIKPKWGNNTPIKEATPDLFRGSKVGQLDNNSAKVWANGSEHSCVRNLVAFITGGPVNNKGGGTSMPSMDRMRTVFSAWITEMDWVGFKMTSTVAVPIIAEHISDLLQDLEEDDAPLDIDLEEDDDCNLVVVSNDDEMLNHIPSWVDGNAHTIVGGMTDKNDKPCTWASTSYEGKNILKTNTTNENWGKRPKTINGISVDETLLAYTVRRVKDSKIGIDATGILYPTQSVLMKAVGFKNTLSNGWVKHNTHNTLDFLKDIGSVVATVLTTGVPLNEVRFSIEHDLKEQLLTKHLKHQADLMNIGHYIRTDTKRDGDSKRSLMTPDNFFDL
jgi:hypothetical protein